MIAVSPELKQFLEEWNDEIYGRHISQLKTEIDEIKYVELENGEVRKEKINKIIPIMYNDIKVIKNATGILIDANKVHSIFKNRKIYWLLGILFTPPCSIWFWQNIISPILKAFRIT